MNEVMGLSTLEERLTQLLGIKKVILVPGDYEKNEKGDCFCNDYVDDNVTSSICKCSRLGVIARSS